MATHGASCSRPAARGTRSATADLANYALNRAAFLECAGDRGPDRARTYETICMHIRERIPAWAMWEDNAP